MNALEDPAAGVVGRAAELARNGWGPVPLPTGRKASPPTGFTGEKAEELPSFPDYFAWVDERGLEAWGNLGARMPRGVVGVDVDAYDGKGGGDVWQALGGPSWPATVRLSSRFGPGYDGVSGIRLYRLPAGVDQGDLWGAHDGVELLRFGHRYAVAPGSTHPSGKLYAVVDERAFVGGGVTFLDNLPPVDELPELPEHLARLLTPSGAPWAGQGAGTSTSPRSSASRPCRRVAGQLATVIGELTAPGASSRYDTMRDAVWTLVKSEDEGHTLGGALEALGAVYERVVGADRAKDGREPPELEYARAVEGARAKVAEHPTPADFRGCCDAAPLTQDVEPDPFVRPELIGQADELVDVEEEERPPFADLSWVLTGKRPERERPAYVARADGALLFYPRRMNLVYGDPEAGKSWVAYVAVVDALEAGGTAAILDVDHNGEGSVVERLLLLGAPPAAIADQSRFRYAEPESGLEVRRVLDELLARTDDVVVVDSIGELVPMLGRNSNNPDEVTEVIRRVLRPLSRAGACVIAIDHLPKGADARAHGPIGAMAKRRAADGLMVLMEPVNPFAPGRVGAATLTVAKDRQGGVRAFALDGKAIGTFELDSTDEDAASWRIAVPTSSTVVDDDGVKRFRPTWYMTRVSAALSSALEPMSKTALSAAVRGNKGHVGKAADRLVVEGFAAVEDGPDGNPRYRHVRLFTEDVDAGIDPLFGNGPSSSVAETHGETPSVADNPGPSRSVPVRPVHPGGGDLTAPPAPVLGSARPAGPPPRAGGSSGPQAASPLAQANAATAGKLCDYPGCDQPRVLAGIRCQEHRGAPLPSAGDDA